MTNKRCSKTYRKYSNKRVNARKENIGFFLSFNDYCQLMREANITHKDIGNIEFHLARYRDKGGYVLGNCRFIPYKENVAERIPSEVSRKASSRNITKVLFTRSKEEKSRIGRLGGLVSGGQNKLTSIEIDRRKKLIEFNNIDLSKYGWVSKVSKLFGLSCAQVKRFIGKYYPVPIYQRKSI